MMFVYITEIGGDKTAVRIDAIDAVVRGEQGFHTDPKGVVTLVHKDENGVVTDKNANVLDEKDIATHYFLSLVLRNGKNVTAKVDSVERRDERSSAIQQAMKSDKLKFQGDDILI